MNREEFNAFKREICDRVIELTDAKGKDYSGTEDIFRNLKMSQSIGIDPKVGVMIRLQDKMARAGNLIAQGGNPAVKDESLEDTLLDVIGYTLLQLGLLEEERRANQQDFKPKGAVWELSKEQAAAVQAIRQSPPTMIRLGSPNPISPLAHQGQAPDILSAEQQAIIKANAIKLQYLHTQAGVSAADSLQAQIAQQLAEDTQE